MTTAEIIHLESEGKDAQSRIKRSREEQDKLVARLNKRFAVVSELGEMKVYCEEKDPVRPGRFRLSRYKFHGFCEAMMNKRLTIDVEDPKHPGKVKSITKTYADIWLNHPNRRECLGGPIFDPTNKASNYYWPLWKGLAIKPVKNRQGWQLMQDHIFHVLAGGVREYEQYLLNSAARLLQHPELPAEVAIVFKGDEGAGKGIYVSALLKILGQHGLHLGHQDHVRGKHNAHLMDRVLVYIDEAMYAGDGQLEGVLRYLITEKDIAIEPKNQDLFEVPNYLHVYMSSNHSWVIPATLRSRRWAVFEVSDHRIDDRAYFKALGHEMEHGGVEAMAWDLLHRNIEHFDFRQIPTTPALLEQRALSLEILPRWWLNCLTRGFVYRSRYGAPSLGRFATFHTNQLLYESHIQFCRDIAWHHPANQVELGKFMTSTGYRHGQKRTWQPIGELAYVRPPPASTPAAGDAGQGDLGLDEPNEVRSEEEEEPTAAIVSDWREQAVVCKPLMTGYYSGSLEEARARFLEATGDIPVPWRF